MKSCSLCNLRLGDYPCKDGVICYDCAKQLPESIVSCLSRYTVDELKHAMGVQAFLSSAMTDAALGDTPKTETPALPSLPIPAVVSEPKPEKEKKLSIWLEKHRVKRKEKKEFKRSHPREAGGASRFAIGKMVLGIFSLLLPLVILIQSFGAGVVNVLSNTGEVGGTAGLLLALFMFVAGLVGISTYRSFQDAGSVCIIILYLLGAFFGFTFAGQFGFLILWSVLCVAFGFVHILSLVFGGMKKRGLISLGILIAFFFVCCGVGTIVAPTSPKQVETAAVSAQNDDKEDAGPTIFEKEGDLGDNHIAIGECRYTKNFSGGKIVIVPISFTNNGENNTTFSSKLVCRGFQAGVELDEALLVKDSTFKVKMPFKKVQPGAVITVEKAYLLNDDIADIDIEVEKLISFDGVKVSKTFPQYGELNE